MDQLITLTQATHLSWLPCRRHGARPNLATIHRWAKKGCKTTNGATVWLQTWKVGGTTCTTEVALREFFAALAAQPEPTGSTPPPRTPGQRSRASERAATELERLGF